MKLVFAFSKLDGFDHIVLADWAHLVLIFCVCYFYAIRADSIDVDTVLHIRDKVIQSLDSSGVETSPKEKCIKQGEAAVNKSDIDESCIVD